MLVGLCVSANSRRIVGRAGGGVGAGSAGLGLRARLRLGCCADLDVAALFAGAFSFASSDAVDAASLTTVGEIRFFGLS